MLTTIAEIEQRATKLIYRPDIDGLRAVAVLLVLLGHLQLHRFAGGFIGVDVFFVISGYLISSVILTDLLAGRFSLVGFYERRVRRIFPALLLMLLVTSALVSALFLPTEVEAFAWSSLAAVFSVSNLYFWHQSGYFDALSSLKPLIHTWSLAVEEQFYMLFPLFLLFVRRWFPGRMRAAIWVVSFVTFAFATLFVWRYPSAAFYFAPLRAWELLIGTILSQRYLPAIRTGYSRNLASILGMLLIILPAMIYNENTPFPGLAALSPCLGAALIIAAGETGPSIVGGILALRPVVFIGLISYSLYLWHWPILVFHNRNKLFLNSLVGERGAKIVLIALSIGVATLSWALVETPFRKGRFRPGRVKLFLINGVIAGLIAAMGIAMIELRGFPSRFPAEALQVAAFDNYDPAPAFRQGTCFLAPENSFAEFPASTCLRADDTRKQFLLLGDSLGAHLYAGLSAVFRELNTSQATVASCPPLLSAPSVPPPYEANCKRMVQFIYGDYLLHHRVDTVLLAAGWRDGEMRELKETVEWIQNRGMRVIVFGPVFDFDMPLPDVLAFSLRKHSSAVIAHHWDPSGWQLDRRMASIVRDRWKIPYISAYEDFCPLSVRPAPNISEFNVADCHFLAEPGVPIGFDNHHFTAQGSIAFAMSIRSHRQLP